MITLRILNIYKVFVFALLFAFSNSAFAQLPDGLTMSISSIEQGGANAKIVVTNKSTSTISFSRRGTVLDIYPDFDQFVVQQKGKALSPIDLHFKRSAEQASELIELAPQEQISSVIDFQHWYPALSIGEFSVVLVSSGQSIELTADGRKLAPLSNFQTKKTFAVRSCSASQTSELDLALAEAEIIARKAFHDLDAASASDITGATRYNRWFGGFDASRYARVRNGFEQIDSAIANQQISFDCACRDLPASSRDQIFAYVLADEPFVVNLCGVFWRAPNSGTDSKSGTIVHELSHFTVLGGTNATRPEVYGTGPALSLAVNDPFHASVNAESYEYFAENTPAFRLSGKDLDRSICRFQSTGSTTPVTQPFLSNSLSDAVDNFTYPFVTDGDGRFFRTTTTSTQGGDSARSSFLNDNQGAFMRFDVEGPATLNFDWRVSSEENFDFLLFGYFDEAGTLRDERNISGVTGWQSQSVSLPAGVNQVVWGYVKDGSEREGLDTAWVDNVRVSGVNVPPSFSSSLTPATELVCESVSSGYIPPIIQLLLDDD